MYKIEQPLRDIFFENVFTQNLSLYYEDYRDNLSHFITTKVGLF